MDKQQKLDQLKEKLKKYQDDLAKALIGYGGVRHESAVSEIKHSKVMVLTAIVDEIKQEIANLEKDINNNLS